MLPRHTILFLGGPLTFVVVYIWSRRNAYIRMNLLGVLNFNAPFLPFVLVLFSAFLHGIPVSDIIGIIVGHFYWVLEDIYPAMRQRQNLPVHRFFAPPRFLMDLFGQTD